MWKEVMGPFFGQDCLSLDSRWTVFVSFFEFGLGTNMARPGPSSIRLVKCLIGCIFYYKIEPWITKNKNIRYRYN